MNTNVGRCSPNRDAGDLAVTAGRGPRGQGRCDGAEADKAKRDLIDFGRALFVEEWMKPLDGDDEVPSEAEALAEFERYLREATK